MELKDLSNKELKKLSTLLKLMNYFGIDETFLREMKDKIINLEIENSKLKTKVDEMAKLIEKNNAYFYGELQTLNANKKDQIKKERNGESEDMYFEDPLVKVDENATK